MTIAIIHDDNAVYIQMSPEKFESLLVSYLEKHQPREAIRMIIADLRREALTK